MKCAQVKFLGIPFRNQRTLGAHPSPPGIGVLSNSWSVAPPSSQTSPNVNGCALQEQSSFTSTPAWAWAWMGMGMGSSITNLEPNYDFGLATGS